MCQEEVPQSLFVKCAVHVKDLERKRRMRRLWVA